MLGGTNPSVDSEGGSEWKSSSNIAISRRPKKCDRRIFTCQFCPRCHNRDFRAKYPRRLSTIDIEDLASAPHNVAVVNATAKDICKRCYSMCIAVLSKARQLKRTVPQVRKEQVVSEYRWVKPCFFRMYIRSIEIGLHIYNCLATRLFQTVKQHQRSTRQGLGKQLQQVSPGKHGRDGTMILCTGSAFVAAAESLSKCPHCNQQLRNAAPIKVHGIQVHTCAINFHTYLV